MLVITAGEALKMAPHILDALAQKALEGNCRAADIYLDFVRKVLIDEKMMKLLKPKKPVWCKNLVHLIFDHETI